MPRPKGREQGRYTEVSRSYYDNYGAYADDKGDSVPLNPTIRIEPVNSDLHELGEVHALQGSVHTTHAAVMNPDRQKTYLIATYTSVLTKDDVGQDWFIPHHLSDQSCDAQTHPLREDGVGQINDEVQMAIEAAHKRGAGRVFFDDAPLIYTESSSTESAPWSREGFGPRPGPSPTSPHTDAGVTMMLHGTNMDSDPQRLVHEGDDAEIFRPGHVDEFAVTCPDIGDLTALTVQVDTRGNDWSSCMWKLDKVVVTCLQSPKADSLQWYFVPPQKWIGSTPCSTARVENDLRTTLNKVEQKEQELEDLKRAVEDLQYDLQQIRGEPWREWKPNRREVRIEIEGREKRPTLSTRNLTSDDDTEGKPLCSCKCCSSPIATCAVFIVLLVILLAVVARAYAIYAQELATAGGSADDNLSGGTQHAGMLGGNPGQYVHGSGDSEHVCEVTPQLTCTCEGTPVIQSCADNFGGAMMPWSGVRQASLAEICTSGISLQLEQGSFTVTTMLEHVNLLIGITQPATTDSDSSFRG